jgi:RNA polymerase sigma-70 factor (ECF subfamily)
VSVVSERLSPDRTTGGDTRVMMTTMTPSDTELYRRHAEELIRYATVLVGPADAPDVVTDAVLSAFGSPGWRRVDRPRAYLYRSVLNTATSWKRSAGRRARREVVVALRPPASPAAPDGAIDVHRALAHLSPKQRAVVFLTSSSPWSVALPGATAAPLDPVAVGLEVDYVDCSTCPTALTIDSTGRYVGWIHPPTSDPDRPNPSIVVKRLADGYTIGYDIAEGTELPLFGSLDIGRFTDDGTSITGGAAIVNAADPADELGAVVFDLLDAEAGNEPVVIGPLGSRMAFAA